MSIEESAIASYVEDEATVEVEETEPEATPEDESETAEAQAEAESKDGAEEKPVEEEVTKGHNRDKGLTQLQQRQATFERQIGDRFDKLESLLTKVGGQGGEATPKQEAQIEAAKDDLDELIGKLADEEFVEGKTLKALVSKIAKRAGGSKDPEVADLKKRVESFEAEKKAAEADRSFRGQFKRQSPLLASQLDDLLEKAAEEVGDLGFDPKGPEYSGAYNATFRRLVKEAEAAAKPNPKADPAKKSVTPKGVQTVKPGATSAAPASGGKPSRTPMFIQD